MLKSEYIQLTKDGSGRRFGDRTVALHISLVLEQLLGQLFSSDPSQLDFYTKPFTVPVVGSDLHAYALLPKPIISFKDLKKGCRSINTIDGTKVEFVPISLLGRKIYPSINTGDKSVGFEVKTDRVIFDNIPTEIKEVVLNLVIPFSKYANDEDIPAPSGVNELIIGFAIDSLMGKDIPINIHKSPTRQPTQ